MPLEAHDTEDQPAAEPRRRGADPLSAATRKRLLGKLLAAAEGGDHQAAGMLLELGAAAERDAALAEMLCQLRDGKDEAP